MANFERTNRSAMIIDTNGSAEQLKRLPFMTGNYNEAWLQQILADNPSIIPTAEIGSEFSSLVLVGREVPVGKGDTQGYIDNLYVSASGNVVVVETKLFRNQESRRTVVAQIIDYAKELQKWDCERLDEVAADYYYKQKGQAFKVFDLMMRNGYCVPAQEAEFTDKVNASLGKARFLLLIVGDGIRSSVQQLAEFLNENTNMSFNLALAEMEMYQLGDGVIVIPNLLTKTAVIERRVISFVDSVLSEGVEVPVADKNRYIQKPVLSRKEFIETFASNGGYDPDEIFELIGDLELINGLSVGVRPTELTIRFSPEDGHSYALFTFSISSNKASVWVMPGRIKEALEKHGCLPFDADEFLEFYKDYVDVRKCKTPPYENMAGFYYADIDKMLQHKREIITASEKFTISIQNN